MELYSRWRLSEYVPTVLDTESTSYSMHMSTRLLCSLKRRENKANLLGKQAGVGLIYACTC